MNTLSLFRSDSLNRFLEEIDANRLTWFVKRLSGNDTNLTGGHQSGIYLPRKLVEQVFPQVCTTEVYNPDAFVEKCVFPQHAETVEKLRVVYYNSKYFPEKGLKKKYDEFRITRWGGKNSPVQNPENTGSVCIIAFDRRGESVSLSVWVSASVTEEDQIEDWLGEEVVPGSFLMSNSWNPSSDFRYTFNLPDSWLRSFPSGKDVFQFVTDLIPKAKWPGSLDALLLKRRDVEYRVFEEIERKHYLSTVRKGFTSISEFAKTANSLLNRRKSRSGKSLELNLEEIFREEDLRFDAQATTENRKKPDFLFPSESDYHNPAFPDTRLHMLAAKTCCKDRWRQVINEADRIGEKHLFTLQEGVSGNQLQEMQDNGVNLVVPAQNLSKYPKEWKSSILTLKKFVDFIRCDQNSLPSQ